MAANKNLKSQVMTLRNDGQKMTEIAIKLNCSLATVKYHCKQSGLTGKGKISKENYDIMKQMLNDGFTQKEISDKINISVSSIKRYKNKSFNEINEHRTYMKDFMKDRRKDLKVKAVEYKGGSCILCGYNRCYLALSFHHMDSDQKDFQISGSNKSWEKIKKELDKCAMVCNNCHAEIHAGLVKIGGIADKV